jgi:hypothetical protein
MLSLLILPKPSRNFPVVTRRHNNVPTFLWRFFLSFTDVSKFIATSWKKSSPDLLLVPPIPIQDDIVHSVKVVVCTLVDIFELPAIGTDLEFKMRYCAGLTEVE